MTHYGENECSNKMEKLEDVLQDCMFIAREENKHLEGESYGGL